MYRHSDIAHRTSLALRRSLDNILAGNQKWIEDFDGEFKENSLSRSNLYKSTSALCTRLSESDSVLIEDEVVQARSGSVLMEIEDLYTMSGTDDEAVQAKSVVDSEVVQTKCAVDNEVTAVISEVQQAKSDVIKAGVQVKSEVKKLKDNVMTESTAVYQGTHSNGSEANSNNMLPEENVMCVHCDDVSMEKKLTGVTHYAEVAMTESSIKQCEAEAVHFDSTTEKHTAKNLAQRKQGEKEEFQTPCIDTELSGIKCNLKDSAIKTIVCEDGSSVHPSTQTSLGSSPQEPPALVEGSHRGLEELTQQEEILLHEMDLLDEMLQVCVDDGEDDSLPGGRKTRMSQGFADALSTLTIDTCWTEDGSDCSSTERCSSGCGYTEAAGSMLSPNLTSKISRIPSCSKLVAPLPYVNLDKYDLGFKTSDHVDVSKVPLVRRGLSYDNLMSASNPASGERYSFRTKSLSCSDSSASCASLSPDTFMRRPPPPLPPKKLKEESTPPKLPPKGPNLLRRQKGMSALFSNVEEGQPRRKLPKPATGRPEPAPQYQAPRSVPTRVSKPVPPLPEPEEPYMLMSDFLPKAVSPSRAGFTCPPVEELAEDDPKSAYMDMSSVMDIPPPILPKCSSGPEIHRMTNVPPQVVRSQSVRTAVEDIKKPQLFHSLSAEPYSENYMEMSAPGLADGSESWLSAGEERAKAAMPFSDLITVQSYRSSQKIELSGTGKSTNNDNNPTHNNRVTDKLDSSSGSSKSLSFFSRLIRTKSKDKKSSSGNVDSADGLKSESGKNKSELALHKVPNRSASICYQNQSNLLAPPSGVDRKRSSSFPNAAVFLENMQGEDKNGTTSNGKAKDKMDKRGSQSEDTLLSLLEKETSGHANDTYSPYWNMAPLQITCTSSCNENKTKGKSALENADETQKGMVADEKGNSSVEETTPAKKVQRDSIETVQERVIVPPRLEQIPSALILSTESSAGTLGPLETAPDMNYDKLSLQTDDEKLLALAKVTDKEPEGSEAESPADGKLTASEEAAAIAEYVAALAPFIPPKTKLHHPGALSPVIEVLATNQAELTAPSVDNSVPKLVKDHPDPTSEPEKSNVLSDAASRKRKARETLRIMPPMEDENGNIWIPRGSLKRSGKSDAVLIS